MPKKVVISDASALIALVDIGELALLQKLYDQIFITDIVREEIHADLPSWIIVSKEYNLKQFQVLKLELDAGEASAIALALERSEAIIILDESKGRSVAKRLGLKVTGTIGIIIKAKDLGIIESGMILLHKLEKHGFWLSERLKRHVAERLGE
ncbi:MAG: DUF3368 domain-containing protein [Saprospiraceae bacterium]|nr:DUF3368 domain-containing protein [Saprospiraceae bacterium]